VAALKEYKQKVLNGTLPSDSSYRLLLTLEEKYGMRVEDL